MKSIEVLETANNNQSLLFDRKQYKRGCFLLKETENAYPQLKKYIHKKPANNRNTGLEEYMFDYSAVYQNFKQSDNSTRLVMNTLEENWG